MKYLPFAILVGLLTVIHNFSADAQRREDVVYLSNGTIIRGMLLSDSTASNISILNHSGDTWVFNRSEVDSITRERPFEFKALIFNKPGLEFSLGPEFLIRSNKDAIGKAVIPGVFFETGYRFSPYLAAGASVGMQFYEQMEIPFSMDIRLRASGRSFSPLLYFKTGYTLPAEKREEDFNYEYKSLGGIHSDIGIGLERIMNENSSFLFYFGYHYQKLKYELSPLNEWVRERDRTETYSRFRMSFALIFR